MGRLLFILFFCGLLLWGNWGQIPVLAAQEPQSSAEEEKKFRVACLGATSHWFYAQTLEMIKTYLAQVGWGHRVVFPEELSFRVDMEDENPEILAEMAKVLLTRDDYDLVLSFGTTATRVLLDENKQGRPMIGLNINDPLILGLINSNTDSGLPYFTTLVYPEPPGRYMFLLFHSLFEFKKLGIMYHDSEDSKVYVYLNDAREVARDQGFELLEYSRLGPKESLRDCGEAVHWLIDQGVDALYLPTLTCFSTRKNDLRPLFDYIYENQVMTFVAEDRFLVKNFAFMGLFFSDLKSQANYHAEQIIAILSGRSPGEVEMIIPLSSRLMINMAAALRLGIKMTTSVVSLSDELYLSLPGLERGPSGPEAPPRSVGGNPGEASAELPGSTEK